MSGTHLNPTLQPLSQVSFRLSQRPPSSQRASRRHIDRAESIEDDELMARLASGIADGDFDNRITPASKTDYIAATFSTPLTASSPMLSLGTAASRSSGVSEMWGPPTQQGTAPCAQNWSEQSPRLADQMDSRAAADLPVRVPLSYIRDHTNLPARSTHLEMSSPCTPRRTALPPQYPTLLTPTQQRKQHQQQQVSNGNSALSQPNSPWRPMSSYRQSAVSKSAQIKRPLLSQRPEISSMALLSQTQPTPTQQTPTKRLRKESRAMAEFRQIATQAISEYCVWWHCLSVEPSPALLCHRPQPGLRLRVSSVQHIVRPHLYCTKAEVIEATAADDGNGTQLCLGTPLTALLSFAVCMDALPQVAERMIDRLHSLASVSNSPLSLGAEPVDVAVYSPWRIQGEGEQQSILASRFHIE
ncbi:hypothetical protein GQ54DRAFT_35435 [Martensiomyces pterosporus]|nr:hypothetical protein GQ54DRAFT_35435 [Martensiomyces pterosporus]